MPLVGFKARNHPQQVASRDTGRTDLLPHVRDLFPPSPIDAGDDVDDRAVPEGLFATWQERFRFTIDVAASHHNAKLPRYYTKDTNGLAADWSGERVYCNPPFSSIEPWVAKAWRETAAPLIVMLLPANRTEQEWWQLLVEPKRDRSPMFRTEFLPARIRFLSRGQDAAPPNSRPPFGCCFLIWSRPQPGACGDTSVA